MLLLSLIVYLVSKPIKLLVELRFIPQNTFAYPKLEFIVSKVNYMLLLTHKDPKQVISLSQTQILPFPFIFLN